MGFQAALCAAVLAMGHSNVSNIKNLSTAHSLGGNLPDSITDGRESQTAMITGENPAKSREVF